jgi:hypothetical protein
MAEHELYSIRRNREVIFLEALNELGSIKQFKTPYTLVRQSAILRFLLIDGQKYYLEINKPYRLNLGAKISSNSLYNTSISSDTPIGSRYEILLHEINHQGEFFKIPNFLKLPAMKIDSLYLKKHINDEHIKYEYTVQDIIKLVANAHGGVHSEGWEDIHPELMTNSHSPFNINSNSKLHDIMKSISNFVLVSLRPLRVCTINNVRNTRAIGAEVSQTVFRKTDES